MSTLLVSHSRGKERARYFLLIPFPTEEKRMRNLNPQIGHRVQPRARSPRRIILVPLREKTQRSRIRRKDTGPNLCGHESRGSRVASTMFSTHGGRARGIKKKFKKTHSLFILPNPTNRANPFNPTRRTTQGKVTPDELPNAERPDEVSCGVTRANDLAGRG